MIERNIMERISSDTVVGQIFGIRITESSSPGMNEMKKSVNRCENNDNVIDIMAMVEVSAPISKGHQILFAIYDWLE